MRLAALLATLALPSLAHADDVHVDVAVDVHTETAPVVVQPMVIQRPPAPILRGSHWELGAFLEAGRISADDVAGGQFGVRGELARQFGALRIGLEYGIAKFAAQRDLYDAMGWWDGWEDVGGEVSRAGITARLRTVYAVPGAPYRADLAFYVEGGVGRQHLAWDTGSSDDRHDFMLGVGFEMAGGADRIGGFDLNLRALVAPSLDASVETHDVGILVGLGGRFGI